MLNKSLLQTSLLKKQIKHLKDESKSNATRISRLESVNSALADRVSSLSRSVRNKESELKNSNAQIESVEKQKEMLQHENFRLTKKLTLIELRIKTDDWSYKAKQQYRLKKLAALDTELDEKRKHRSGLR